jgi:hypothetical protein
MYWHGCPKPTQCSCEFPIASFTYIIGYAPHGPAKKRYTYIAEAACASSHFGALICGCMGLLHACRLPIYLAVHVAAWVWEARSSRSTTVRRLLMIVLRSISDQYRSNTDSSNVDRYISWSSGTNIMRECLPESYHMYCRKGLKQLPCLGCVYRFCEAQ